MSLRIERRGAGLVAALLLVSLLLLAQASAQPTIKMCCWDLGPNNARLFGDIAERFNAMQDEIVLVPAAIPGNIRESVLLRWGTGIAPDLVCWYGPWYPGMIEQGALHDPTP